MNHPDRYALAQFDAQVAIGKGGGFSERAVLKQLLGIAIGKPDPAPDNLARMSQALPFRVWTPPLRLPPCRLRQSDKDRVENERYRDAFAPYLEDLQRQLRNLRTRVDLRGRWHRTMKRVFLLFCAVDAGAAEIDLARRLAASVGERAYFEKELLPLMIADVERRAGQNAP
jgi:hypothetical protein